MSLWPVYIISKGRAKSAIVWKELNPTLVVESQEKEEYDCSFPSVPKVILTRSNQGIVYVRNFVKSINSSWYWIIDDDVKSFGFAHDRKCIPASPIDVLIEAKSRF